MSDQKDLVECILGAKAGSQVSLSQLPSKLENLLQDSQAKQEMCRQGEALALQMKGASSRTSEALYKKIAPL